MKEISNILYMAIHSRIVFYCLARLCIATEVFSFHIFAAFVIRRFVGDVYRD